MTSRYTTRDPLTNEIRLLNERLAEFLKSMENFTERQQRESLMMHNRLQVTLETVQRIAERQNQYLQNIVQERSKEQRLNILDVAMRHATNLTSQLCTIMRSAGIRIEPTDFLTLHSSAFRYCLRIFAQTSDTNKSWKQILQEYDLLNQKIQELAHSVTPAGMPSDMNMTTDVTAHRHNRFQQEP
ncbi:hypothetical protein [Thermosulfurimonas sp. F29]|uniref:hypothetical protein n=1 Tax=Thermosulfurimonas sp. F29 TaxID=2867247 RepID=UPI001C839DB8|nr:hypothetical protein [Thermosulfurimonas sp. F29]MBX6423370.1 hypothetical protein [Thermosulfurimonas sp. F29]